MASPLERLEAAIAETKGDPEMQHVKCEAVMLEVLREQGLVLFADLYEKASESWYYA